MKCTVLEEKKEKKKRKARDPLPSFPLVPIEKKGGKRCAIWSVKENFNRTKARVN